MLLFGMAMLLDFKLPWLLLKDIHYLPATYVPTLPTSSCSQLVGGAIEFVYCLKKEKQKGLSAECSAEKWLPVIFTRSSSG